MDDINSITEQLAEYAPDALVVADEHGIIRFVNQAAAAAFRCARETLVGQPFSTLIPERFRARHAGHVARYLEHAVNREMGDRTDELVACRMDGSEFPAAIRLAPLRSGGALFVVAAVRDVTQRRAMSLALIQAREEADRANRAKSRLLATASHDLRQPLQSIRLLNAAMAKAAPGGAQLHESLRQQQLAIDGATRLLNSLLDISRLESGAVRPQWAPLKLADLFAELEREFAPSAAVKHLALEFPATDLALKTDHILLAQLLQNLLGNATKYTEDGYVRVTQALDADSLIITVEDSGAGIPGDKLDRIFDEYYQLGPEGTQRVGVGLGLAIVREVARILNYSVQVESALGKGTQVRVRIPRHALMSQVQVPPPEAGRSRARAARLPCRVFVIEDNDSVRTATQLFLSLEGYETACAASVAEFNKLASGMRAGDIVIADYHLGGRQTGIDALRQVRGQLGCEVPAIILSGDLQSMGQAMKEPLARCVFLNKPVDTQQLLEAIADLTGT